MQNGIEIPESQWTEVGVVYLVILRASMKLGESRRLLRMGE